MAKYYLNQKKSYVVYECDLPPDEALEQWNWRHDPLNLTPRIYPILVLLTLPLLCLSLFWGCLLYCFKFLYDIGVELSGFILLFSEKVLDNHTVLTTSKDKPKK